MIRLFLSFATVAFLWMIWDHSAGLRGWVSATLDTHSGRYEILTYGLPPPWMERYRDIMRERHGVVVRKIAGCVVTRSLTEYAHSYNGVSIEAILRMHGRDVLAKARDEAETSEKATRPPDR